MANPLRSIIRSLTPLSGINDPNTPLYRAIADLQDGLATGSGGALGLPRVTSENAVRLTAVYRSVMLLAALGRLPLHTFDRKDGRRVEVNDPKERYVWGRPNPDVSRSVFWETAIAHVALAGNCYIYPVRNGVGEIVELWPVQPKRVAVGRDPVTRRKVFVVDGDRDAPYMGRGSNGEPGDLVHVPGLTLDGLVGINPIRAAQLTAQLAVSAEEYGAAVFAQGSTPRGVITTAAELEPEEADALARQWEKHHKGLTNAHKVAVLDNGAKWEATTLSPEDAQFLTTRQFQVQEIARLFGVPPHLLADSSGSTSWGSGLEEQNNAFVTFTLSAYSARFEEAISDELIETPTRYAKWNYAALLRGNTLQRYQAYAIARTNGWLNADEIRAFEDLEPLPDGLGASYLTPLNMTPVSLKIGDQTVVGDPAGDASTAA